MVRVEYHADLKEVQCDPQLARLLNAQMQHLPFDRLAWWQGLNEHCSLIPLIAVARDGADIAVLPLQSSGGHLQAFSNWYNFTFRPITSKPEAAPQLLAAIARDLGRRVRRVTLSGLPSEDGSRDLVADAFRRGGWRVFSAPCDNNHILHVHKRSYAEYLADRPGPLRSTLKRKAGKVQIQIIACFDTEAWDAYEAIYQSSWKPSEGSPAFLRAFAEAEGAAGRLRLGIAFAEGRAVAAQFWTVDGGTAFIHKLAHLEDAKPISPGTSLSAAMFQHVIDRDGVTLVDFGTGDDAYKRDWMEDVRVRYRLDMLRPANPRNWPLLARRLLGRLAPATKRG